MRCVPLLLILVTFAWAQTEGADNPVTFISPDRTFQFKYPSTFVLCHRGADESSWTDDACNAYVPICSDYEATSTHTLACIGYPRDEILEGTTFQGAAFAVNVDPGTRSKRECAQMMDPPPRVGKARQVVVNGATFQLVQTDGVAAGNYADGYAYRTFHRNKCYELDIRIGSSNAANYDPGTIREFDSERVHAQLEKVLKSFKFLK